VNPTNVVVGCFLKFLPVSFQIVLFYKLGESNRFGVSSSILKLQPIYAQLNEVFVYTLCCCICFNLEKAVGRAIRMQDIVLNSVMKIVSSPGW